ncbi:mandelate racemase/muconate lactonizing enzyme family protein [Aquamicrobium sp. LC103]|uniref:mandelate racemase/muconate lactonizing enzyme family protein n=1 Tax=Aquamicrobium sp. LC103 TaxID=1120658 RepID=UPI00063EC0E0|nr:mandelate racemase/muconate lactonizing enzyme family protein [Aquamicrobium sp. LC103]TKT69872.1 mandelate racemase/muconate lactonizing enzyme family protein [Aquamicrobium sp. LC103]
MKITSVETVQVPPFYNLCWVRLHTDEGLTGLGETFRNAAAVAAYTHDVLAPLLLGRDPMAINGLVSDMRNRLDNRFQGFPTRSIELQSVSAVDIALWDLLGKALGQPLYQLLGGACRDRIPVYNTCVRPGRDSVARRLMHYAPGAEGTTNVQGGRGGIAGDNLEEPGELAEELLAEGFTAMKYSPFDAYADKTRGYDISLSDLKDGIKSVEKIRKAVGARIDIYVDYHTRWQLPGALKIAAALNDFDVAWHEDAVQMHNMGDLQTFREHVRGHVVGAEAYATVDWLREMLPRRALDIVMFDTGWIGGVSETRDIAALCRSFGRPFSPHDATGPIVLLAGIHQAIASPAALKQEVVRTFLKGYYRDLVTELPRMENGHIQPPESAGLGTELQPALFERQGVQCRVSAVNA